MMINSVLEKKLEELEYLIESLTFNNDDLNVYRDIELRLVFAKTLLATEISSRPMETEGEKVSEERLKLASMAKSLDELEEAFKTKQFSGNDDGSLDSDDGEAGSVYSWVDSCLGELGKPEEGKEEAEEKGDEDVEQWPLFEDASSEEKKEVMFPAAAVKEEVVVRKVKKQKRFGFMDLVCFGLLGVVITLLLGYIDDITEDHVFLTPT